MGNFKWIKIVIYLWVLSLTFQLKANDCVRTYFVYLFTKDSVSYMHLNFQSFFSGKKVRIIHGLIRYLIESWLLYTFFNWPMFTKIF